MHVAAQRTLHTALAKIKRKCTAWTWNRNRSRKNRKTKIKRICIEDWIIEIQTILFTRFRSCIFHINLFMAVVVVVVVCGYDGYLLPIPYPLCVYPPAFPIYLSLAFICVLHIIILNNSLSVYLHFAFGILCICIFRCLKWQSTHWLLPS